LKRGDLEADTPNLMLAESSFRMKKKVLET
jgi:hypothetical protein